MFNNIGKKIKTYSEIVAYIGISASIISGLVICAKSGTVPNLLHGLAVAVIGSLSCWIGSLFLYGFGQLVENSDILVEKFAPEYRRASETVKPQRREKYEYDFTEWDDKVRFLSDEELMERINSDDWRDEYKAICKRELEKRRINFTEIQK